jgi:hypothetical protein
VSQIQLLSHQSKIATRIELFVGTGNDYYEAQFTRLGYLSLDSNERSQYKVRRGATLVFAIPTPATQSQATRALLWRAHRRRGLKRTAVVCRTTSALPRMGTLCGAQPRTCEPIPRVGRPQPPLPVSAWTLSGCRHYYTCVSACERTALQARELKSVYLKARGCFMKLLVHKCYINPLNLFNQVREGRKSPPASTGGAGAGRAHSHSVLHGRVAAGALCLYRACCLATPTARQGSLCLLCSPGAVPSPLRRLALLQSTSSAPQRAAAAMMPGLSLRLWWAGEAT